MLGDKIHIRPEYYRTANELMAHFLPTLAANRRHVIAIGGESGSGKSVLAHCLSDRLQANGIGVVLWQLDDYFRLPPADNHAARVESLANVGLQEVDMVLLQQHLDAFKNGATQVLKPISSYIHNRIAQEISLIDDAQILIVEGTYALCLDGIDTSVFINRCYKDTIAQRQARGRDEIDAFSEEILQIEHEIVKKSGLNADFIVEKDYSLHS
jgi:uridine kinase